MTKYTLLTRIAKKIPATIARVRYFQHLGKFLHLNVPLNEVNQLVVYVIQSQLKNKDNARWGVMADKYAVRKEVERLVGAEYLIPLLGCWENPEDIDFEILPVPYVLKTNNGCGTYIFIHDRSQIDCQSIISNLKKSLAFPYPELSGQLHYSQIKPCVIAEKLITQSGKRSLTDYKIHCVNGIPQIVFVFSDRDEVSHYEFNVAPYTTQWQLVPQNTSPEDILDKAPVAAGKPENFEEMLEVARKLSAGDEYVRVDLYNVDGKIYFGEMTYTPDVGYHKAFKPYVKVMDYILAQIKRAHSGS